MHLQGLTPRIGLALVRAARDAGGLGELRLPERSDGARAVDFAGTGVEVVDPWTV